MLIIERVEEVALKVTFKLVLKEDAAIHHQDEAGSEQGQPGVGERVSYLIHKIHI